jgi:hypothetical protein
MHEVYPTLLIDVERLNEILEEWYHIAYYLVLLWVDDSQRE